MHNDVLILPEEEAQHLLLQHRPSEARSLLKLQWRDGAFHVLPHSGDAGSTVDGGDLAGSASCSSPAAAQEAEALAEETRGAAEAPAVARRSLPCGNVENCALLASGQNVSPRQEQQQQQQPSGGRASAPSAAGREEAAAAGFPSAEAGASSSPSAQQGSAREGGVSPRAEAAAAAVEAGAVGGGAAVAVAAVPAAAAAQSCSCEGASASPEKVWLVVRSLRERGGVRLHEGDVLKLGRFRLRVKEAIATQQQALQASAR